MEFPTVSNWFCLKGRWMVFFHFYLTMQANIGDPDQTPRSVASGLGLHCYPLSHKKALYGLIYFVSPA